jgi:phytoene dehydrogenase-like protein
LSTIYDTIIVGAGVAGLSAAATLRGNVNRIIEEDGYLGGRVSTFRSDGMNVDLGACYAFDPSIIFKSFAKRQPGSIQEKGYLGIS